MTSEQSALEAILEAAKTLIAEHGYGTLRMTDLARAAKLPLAEIYRHTPSRAQLLAAFIRRTDLAVLESLPEWTDADSPRERIFDLLMARFEQLSPLKDMLRVVQHDLRRQPGDAFQLAPTMLRAMRWMAEAAGLDTAGLKGAARVRALGAAYASVLPVWLSDDDPGLAKTMAALDRRLRRVESLWREAFGAAPAAAPRGTPSPDAALH